MHDPDLNQPPFNPIAPVVVILALAMLAVEIVFQGGARGFFGGQNAVGWRSEAIQAYGVYDTILDWMFATGRFPPEHLLRFVAYPFIHGSFTHLIFALVITLAIGKMVAEVFSAFAVVVVFFASAIGGAVVYSLMFETGQPLFGAYPAVYGLIGAFTFMLWAKAKYTGQNQFRAFYLIGFLMALQLFFKIVFGGGNDWVADLSGFATGFVLSFVLSPAGPQRVLGWFEKIRRR